MGKGREREVGSEEKLWVPAGCCFSSEWNVGATSHCPPFPEKSGTATQYLSSHPSLGFLLFSRASLGHPCDTPHLRHLDHPLLELKCLCENKEQAGKRYCSSPMQFLQVLSCPAPCPIRMEKSSGGLLDKSSIGRGTQAGVQNGAHSTGLHPPPPL